MKLLITLAVTLVFLRPAWSVQTTILEEKIYLDFQKNIQSKENQKSISQSGFTRFEQSLFVDALWDLVEDKNPEALSALDDLQDFNYDLVEKLRIGLLRIKSKQTVSLPKDLQVALINALKAPVVEIKLLYMLASYEADLLLAGHKNIVTLARKHPAYFDVQDEEVKNQLSTNVIADVFNHTPDSTTYMNGEYVKSVKIFMFCRENRLYPCMMVMKDVHGEPVRNADGKLWTHKSLASSARGLPSYARNGSTPTGIFTIDSVMPVIDAPMSFGKNRRMILNFIPKSKDETLFKSLLPESSHNEAWWKANVTAREIGRNLFRIHGTGKINVDPTTPYFPFMRTSGCIAQRENTYDNVVYQDQRQLLDAIMTALDLEPVFDNELKVKGILYVMEIDDKDTAVALEDLALRGIE